MLMRLKFANVVKIHVHLVSAQREIAPCVKIARCFWMAYVLTVALQTILVQRTEFAIPVQMNALLAVERPLNALRAKNHWF